MEKLEEVGMYENCKEEVKEMYRKKKKLSQLMPDMYLIYSIEECRS